MFERKRKREEGDESPRKLLKIQPTIDYVQALTEQKDFSFAPLIVAALGTPGYSSAAEVFERLKFLREHAANEICGPLLQRIIALSGCYPPLIQTDFMEGQSTEQEHLRRYLATCGVLNNLPLAEKIINNNVNPSFSTIYYYCKSLQRNFAGLELYLENIEFSAGGSQVTEFESITGLLASAQLFDEKVLFVAHHLETTIDVLPPGGIIRKAFVKKYFEDNCKDLLEREWFPEFESFAATYEMSRPESMIDTIYYLVKKGAVKALEFLHGRAEFKENPQDENMVEVMVLAALEGKDADKTLKVIQFFFEKCDFVLTAGLIENVKKHDAIKITEYLESKLAPTPKPG